MKKRWGEDDARERKRLAPHPPPEWSEDHARDERPWPPPFRVAWGGSQAGLAGYLPFAAERPMPGGASGRAREPDPQTRRCTLKQRYACSTPLRAFQAVWQKEPPAGWPGVKVHAHWVGGSTVIQRIV